MTSRRKRISAVVMALSAGVLAVDRFFLTDPFSGPEVAEASEQLMSLETDPALPFSIPELPFPGSIKPLTLMAEMRDLFTPPQFANGSGYDNNGSDKLGAATITDGEEKTGSAKFVAQHKLGAVLVDQGLKIAIVDATWVRLGQSIDDCALVELSDQGASFWCHDGIAVLRTDPEELTAGRP